jgi:Cu(I)/Ag(I) efflux system periplasmic protein CusF
MISRRSATVLFASLVFSAVVGSAAAAEEHYSTRGVVKSFGPKREYVNIAHETIPGYMRAMTMSFEPRRADQFEGLEVGQRVAVTFTATDKGQRLIDSISVVKE